MLYEAGECIVLLSVIIPVYNGEKYLRQAVESVISQPYKGLEVICINDGSADGSAEILQSIAQRDERVRIFTQSNQGVASARNRGVMQAQGTYIAFLDQDDCYCKNILSNVLAESISDGQYDMVSFAYYISNQDMTRGHLYPRENVERRNLANFAGENYRHHSSYFFRTEFVKENNILTDIYRNEDERFRMQCVYSASYVRYVSQSLFVYRNNKDSVAHRRGKNSPVLDSCYDGFSLLSRQSQNPMVVKYCMDTMQHLLLETAKQLVIEGDSPESIMAALEKKQARALYERRTWISTTDRRNWELFFNHIHWFVVKHRLAGLLDQYLRITLRCPVILYLYEKQKYPKILDGVV